MTENTQAGQSAVGIAAQVAEALRSGEFDPQHGGEHFLRADAERALRAQLNAGIQIAVAGRDDPRLRPTSFLGARFAPDLVVDAPGAGKVAVTITLLRGDAGPVSSALAAALVLAGRYDAVVAFILDRRLARRNPFDDPADAPEPRELSAAETALVAQLAERQRVFLLVRRQDPFGWG